MGRKEIIDDLERFLSRINCIINVDNVFLFGSRAKGRERSDSDIDLVVISKDFEGKKYFRRASPLYLAWDSRYDIDIICLTPKEFSRKKEEVGIIKEAASEGISL